LKKFRISHIVLFLHFLSHIGLAQEQDYSSIDSHALNAPASLKSNPRELAVYLTRPAKNDFQKIRAIFRWVTNNIDYDVDAYFSGKELYKSPEDALSSGKAVCDGYSGVVKMLADFAGLEVVKISGYSKGYGYNVGDSPGSPNHAWNAVKINGKWYLFDSTWGAGAVGNSGSYQRKFEEFYFLTPAEFFIYDHFPEDPQWQLLENRLSKESFSNLPYLRPRFFNTKLNITESLSAVNKTSKNLRLEISAPQNVLITTSLLDDKESNLDDFVFIQREDDKFLVDVVFPAKGKYNLRIYSKFAHEEGNYDWAADYGFIAIDGMQNFLGFPTRYEKFNTSGGILYSPSQKTLTINRSYNFRIKVPGAEKVAVIINDQFYFLKPMKDGSQIFHGDIKISGENIMVGANYGSGNTFEGLLNFTAK